MLHLHSATSQRWLDQVQANLDEVLIDHAHCEKKAAVSALNLMCAYIDHQEFSRPLTDIVNEELEHFHQVMAIINQRGIRFRVLTPARYAGCLQKFIRAKSADRAVDRFLIAGLIEARSCERFGLLRDHLPDQELAAFFGSLFESEARHHVTYIKFAQGFADEEKVERRLRELAIEEAKIIAEGDSKPRMHS